MFINMAKQLNSRVVADYNATVILFLSTCSSFLDNELEMEFALPSNFDPEEIECAIQVAEEMGVLYEKGGKVSD